MRRKATTLLSALLVGLILLAGCTPLAPVPAPIENPGDREACVDANTGASMTLEEATRIAIESECGQKGTLTESYFCNENTGTWWIDLEIDQPGCAPACVVDVNTGAAEINWRCTGAIPPMTTVAQSDKPRQAADDVSPADLAGLVSGNSQFAIDLYQAIREAQGNLFFSPYSISVALAMTFAGARNETARQMADTLSFTLPPDRLHPAFNGLDSALAQRAAGGAGSDGEGFRLNIVNALWGQEGYGFLAEFLDLLAENYGAGLRLLDFVHAPEESRLQINDWVSEQTESRIKDLIPQGAIDELTRLVLTNAIYFNAAWLYPFTEEQTHDAPFTLLDGSQVTVPMMSQTESFGYSSGDGYQAVELPYEGQQLSMVILLPDAGQFAAFEQSLKPAVVDAILAGLGARQVALSMPKFEFSADLSLADTLAAMGMPDAFEGAADFSGMTGTRDLFISDVLHKAFVSVDEAGTEAAAATAVVMKLTGMPEEPITVTMDRPFIFLIRDIPTGAILFLGRVVDPTAS
jgi:serpin B